MEVLFRSDKLLAQKNPTFAELLTRVSREMYSGFCLTWHLHMELQDERGSSQPFPWEQGYREQCCVWGRGTKVSRCGDRISLGDLSLKLVGWCLNLHKPGLANVTPVGGNLINSILETSQLKSSPSPFLHKERNKTFGNKQPLPLTVTFSPVKQRMKNFPPRNWTLLIAGQS